MKSQNNLASCDVVVIDPLSPLPRTHRLRVAAYIRVSSSSEEQLHSFAAQLNYYNDLFNKHDDWEKVDIYADEGITGTSMDKRDELLRLIRDCRRGLVDKIITKSVSRFARNLPELLRTIRELKGLGVSVWFEKENVDTASMKCEQALTMHALCAQQESKSISKNQKMSVQRRMQMGTIVPSCAPYGFRLNGTPQLDSEGASAAEIMNFMFTLYYSGNGYTGIYKTFLNLGITNKIGKPWTISGIRNALLNVRYKGDSLYGSRYTPNTFPFHRAYNHGEAAIFYIKGTHPGLVGTDLFDGVQEYRQIKRQKFYHPSTGKYDPLRLKIKCSSCGSTFKRKIINDTVYWSCRKHEYDSSLCSQSAIPQKTFYMAFCRLFNRLRLNESYILLPMLVQLQELKENRHWGDPKLAELNSDMANLAEQNRILNDLKVKGYVDPALFLSKSNELNRRIQAIREAKRRLCTTDEETDPGEETEDLLNALHRGPDYLESFDDTLFTEMVDIITVSGKTMQFHLINGLALTEQGASE